MFKKELCNHNYFSKCCISCHIYSLIYLHKECLELIGLSKSVSGLFLSIFLLIMQAMVSITPNAIKSIRITVVITGNKTIRYKFEVDELLGELEAVIFTVVVDSIA